MQNPTDDVTQFNSVDQAANPAFFTQFMNTSHAQQTARVYKQRILEQLALREGATVLDIGCGTGQDAQDLAHIVGPRGRVVGIDSSETMLQVARAASLQLPIEYILADAIDLPFADASFDGCQASRVLSHLQDSSIALAEMVRVIRPGARIVVADADFDLIVIDIADRALARKITHATCDYMKNGWLGRQLPRLLQQAGLENIRVDGSLMPLDYAFFQLAFNGILQSVRATGAVSEDELISFWDALKQAEQEGHFFARMGGFVVSGRKPL